MARSTGEDRARAWPRTLRRPADRPLRGSRGGQLKLPTFFAVREWMVVFLRKYVYLHQRKVNKKVWGERRSLLAASQSWWLLFPSHGSAHRLLASGRASRV